MEVTHVHYLFSDLESNLMQFNKLRTSNTTSSFHKFTESQNLVICISNLKNFTYNFVKV